MTGGNILSIGENDYGIVPRAVQTIFETLEVTVVDTHADLTFFFRIVTIDE